MIAFRSVRRPTVLLTAGVLSALALTACAGGSGSSSAGSAQADSGSQFSQSQASPDKRAAADSGVKESSGGKGSSGTAGNQGSVSPAALQATQQQLARRASIALQVKDIRQAVARVRAATAAAGGIVLSENIGSSTGEVPLEQGAQVSATTYGEIAVSVPQDQLDEVLDQLAGLGTVIRSQSSSEDVGAQIVDTQARLKTMQASVDRVRALMTRATDLTQVVALESELSRRQADLEALESQLAALKGSVAMSPVQVSLTTNPAVIAPTQHDTGFLAGLRKGWNAFTDSVVVVLTGVGALLPFAVAAAVLGLPVWWLLRRRRASRPVQPAPTVSAS